MGYFLKVLSIGVASGVLLAGTVAAVLWPDEQVRVEYRVQVIERDVQPGWDPVPTPVVDSLLTDEEWAEIERQSDCLFDWLQQQVGYDITLERVLAAGYWTEALGGACAVLEADGR